MTQEEKELLLVDLCARLPYGVKVEIKLPNHENKTFDSQVGTLKEISSWGEYLVNSKGIEYRSFSLDIKPYLRPMSSMTEEEKKLIYDPLGLWNNPVALIDMLNSCHLDYRGLIDKGLALEAKEGMYNL